MTRIYTVPAGAISITTAQKLRMQTSDGLYFRTSDGLDMYLKSGDATLLLLNNIYAVPVETRSFVIASESRSLVVASE